MTTSRGDRGFRFPYDKYEDEIALYANFRYLQEYLNYIRKFDEVTAQEIVTMRGQGSEFQGFHRADGSADDVELQAAFDALPSEGGEVTVLDGDYQITSDITLPAGIVRLKGNGAKMSCSSGVGFISNSHTILIVDGVEFTRTGSSDTDIFFALGSRGGQAVFEGCSFHDMGATGIIGGSGGGRLLTMGCRFETITLNENFDTGIIRYDSNPGGSNNNWLVFTGNYVADLTDNSGSRDAGIMFEEGGGNTGIVIGNVFQNIDSIPLAVGAGSYASHNIVDEVLVAGDHDGLDHGALDGLSDDDHTQYVLRNILTTQGDIFKRGSSIIERLAKGSDGQFLKSGASDLSWATLVEADINDLDHTDTDAIHDNVSGEIAALTQVTAAGGDHILIEDTSDSNNKKRIAASDLIGSGALDDLTDVTITTPADNELLAYDSGSGEWINQTLAEAGHDTHDHSTALSTAVFGDLSNAEDTQTYTPVLTASTTNPTLGTGSTQTGHYTVVDDLVSVSFRIVFGSSSIRGSGSYAISLPVSPDNSNYPNTAVGFMVGIQSGETIPVWLAIGFLNASDETVGFRATDGYATVAHNSPNLFGDGDSMQGTFQYKKA